MAQKDREPPSDQTDPATLLAWLRRFADELRGRLPESQEDLAAVERNVALLEFLDASSETLGKVRLNVARGISHLRLPAADADLPSSLQLIQTVATEGCWSLVNEDELPEGWLRAFRLISSNELATLVSTVRAVRKNREPLRVKQELTSSLADPKYAPGIWNLLEDLQDEQGGWPWLSAVLTQRDGRPPRRPRDLRWLLGVIGGVGSYLGVKALDGIIGNRADELLGQAIDYLKPFVEPRLARGETLQPEARSESAPASPSSALARPLLIELPKLGFRFELVHVPEGAFLMGSDLRRDKAAYKDEQPQHWVYLDEYYIGRYLITVAQFATFVRARNFKTTAELRGSAYIWSGSSWGETEGANWQHPRGPRSDVGQKQSHPVTCVSWDDATAFCKWLSEVSGRDIRLPSEAQWEKAARWDEQKRHARIWPWGDTPPPDDKHCNFNMTVQDTTPVGRYSPLGDSPYGCVDMAGNVWEWCADWWDEKEYERRERRSGIQLVQQMAARACCAAARSSAMLPSCAAPSATGTTQTPPTSASVFVPVRSPSTSELCSSVL